MALVFLSALTVGFSGAMMPGSLLTYTIRQSLSTGPRAGFIVAAGHAALELILVVLIFLGFGGLLQSGAVQIGIGLIGGALLAYMGIDMIAGAIRNTIKVKMDGHDAKTKSLFLSGIAVSAMNPYFLLWWAVIGLGFIMQAYVASGLAGVGVYYLGHISADFIWYGFISAVVGTTKKFIKETPYRVVIALLGGLLIFFGGKFLLIAISKLIVVL